MIFKPNFLGLRKGGAEIPRDGLIGEWLFSGNANDTSGNGNNGTVNGATLTTDRFANANSAYDFDGNDQITLSAQAYVFLNNPFTISFWFYIDSYTPSFANFLLLQTDQSNGFIIFSGQGSGYNTVTFGSNLNFGRYTESPRIPIVGLWTHACLTYDALGQLASNYSLYIENSLQTLINANTFGAITNINKFGYFSAGQALNGKLDNIRIYNRVLTSDEITALYNE